MMQNLTLDKICNPVKGVKNVILASLFKNFSHIVASTSLLGFLLMGLNADFLTLKGVQSIGNKKNQ